ncbi:MAG TPA: hypothetical protein VFW78_02165 [Bacteroidia bacterium]|nr:hypothetical protein [Bacteroidia bacterium]
MASSRGHFLFHRFFYLGSVIVRGQKKNYSAYWLVAALVFFAAFLLCGFYNRPASDDFEFLRVVKAKGVTGSMLFFRDTWNTRWAAILWLNIWLKCYLVTGTFFWYHLITLLALITSASFAVKRVTSYYLHSPLNNKTIFILASCIAMALFYSTFSIPDTWFWINTSTMYGWSHIYAFLAIGALFSKQHTIKDSIVLVIAAIFIGGGNEPFALNAILISGFAAIALTKTNAANKIRMLLLFIACVALSFLYSYAGNGHTVRSSLLPHPGVTGLSWILVKSLVKFTLLYLPSRLPAILLFLVPFYFLGSNYKGMIRTRSLVRYTFIAGAILLVTALAPVVFIMAEMGPERAWSQLSLYLTLGGAILFFIAGYRFRERIELIRIIPFTGIMGIALVIATSVSAVFQAKAYSHAWDNRMHSIATQLTTASDEILVTGSLPAPGWLHSAEIAEQPEHFTNQHLQHYLNTPLPIRRIRNN